MSEHESKPADAARSARSKWLFAVVGALVVAVAIQSIYLWQMHDRLEKAVAAHTDADDNEGWIEIPRPDSLDRNRPGPSQSRATPPGTLSFGRPDPFLQPFDPKTWDPFREMDRMRSEMDRIFNEAFGRFHTSPRFGSLAGQNTYSPSFDLSDEPDRYVVKVDVPGASEHDITVTLEGQDLTISGTRTDTRSQQEDGKLLRQERVTGQFHRTLTLPEPVDDTQMKTTYEDGVFTVTLPKLKAPHGSIDPSKSVRMK
ncbi:MAG: hypothetical protein AMXMBFR82_20390 [Candidatus Hydrogenedentota bacterium]